MAIHTTDAIILRKQDIRETSLLVTFYTPEFGKIKGLMKGIRGPRGPLGPQAELFTLNKIVFYDSKRSAIHTVPQCDLIDFFGVIREDIAKTSYACYFIELVDALTEDNDKNEDIYNILLRSLVLLDAKSSPERISRILEIRLLMTLGIMPRLDKCVLCDKEINFNPQHGNPRSCPQSGRDRGMNGDAPLGGREPRALARGGSTNGSFDKARFSYKSGGLICEGCFRHDSASRKISPGTAYFINHVGRAPYGQLERIRASRDVGKELEEIMRDFMGYHLDVRIKSLEFMEKMGADVGRKDVGRRT